MPKNSTLATAWLDTIKRNLRVDLGDIADYRAILADNPTAQDLDLIEKSLRMIGDDFRALGFPPAA